MNNRVRVSAVVAGAFLATIAAPLAAHAAPSGDVAYGVSSGGNRLIIFDPLNPTSAGQGTPITGLGTGESVAGIDTRPAKGGTLYALTDDASGTGRLYLIDTFAAAATRIGTATYALGADINTAHFDIDFNTVSGGLRVVGSNGINLRLNADTGALTATDPNLAYAAGDANAAATPRIGGAAYTAPAGSPAATTLYDVDFSSNTLDTQGSVGGAPTSPNTGTLSTVGGFGIDPQSLLGFDISQSTGTAYLAAQVQSAGGVNSSATQMYTVNLATGQATAAPGGSSVGGATNADLLQTFAVGPALTPAAALPDFPAPAAAVVAALGVGGFALLRRRRSV